MIHRDLKLPKREIKEVWYCITINYAWVKLTFVSGLPSACSRKILWGPVYAKAHFRGHARSCPLYMYMYIVQPCLFRGFKHVAVCRLSAKSTKIGPLEKFLLYNIHLHTAIKVIYFSSLSTFQASSSQSLQSPAAISGSTSGVGTGSERPFPPSNGLTFSCWLHFTK
jgi:hypothetical protein